MDGILLREEFPTEQQLQQRLNEQAGRSVVNADHTRHLYRVDEALSAMQKAIRRSHVEDALYWASELDMSGYHRATMQRLVLIGSEDVAFGIPRLPRMMCDAFMAWEEEKKAGREAGFRARSLLLGLCWTLASGPKSRTACIAAGYAVREVHRALQAASPALGAGECASCGFAHLQALRAGMDAARGDLAAEAEALMHLQLLMYEGEKWGWEKQVWRMLLELPPTSDLVSEGIRALYEVDQAIQGVERLRVFHAALLYTRERWLDGQQPVPRSAQCEDPAFVEAIYAHGRHPHGVPLYCVDKHTLRGHGTGPGPIVRGRSSMGDLRKAAKVWQMDVAEWTPEEVARSHGPGRGWPRDRRVGLPTMLSQFMDEGVLVVPEAYPGPETQPVPNAASKDPMHQPLRDFYLEVEELHGPMTRPTSFVYERLTEARRANRLPHFHSPPPALPASPTGSDAAASQAAAKKKKSRVQGNWGR
eukprot:EG_transcript_10650